MKPVIVYQPGRGLRTVEAQIDLEPTTPVVEFGSVSQDDLRMIQQTVASGLGSGPPLSDGREWRVDW